MSHESMSSREGRRLAAWTRRAPRRPRLGRERCMGWKRVRGGCHLSGHAGAAPQPLAGRERRRNGARKNKWWRCSSSSHASRLR